jgi:hypothetical protein
MDAPRQRVAFVCDRDSFCFVSWPVKRSVSVGSGALVLANRRRSTRERYLLGLSDLVWMATLCTDHEVRHLRPDR